MGSPSFLTELPPMPGAMVKRARLVGLCESLSEDLILILGPGGYGKTVLARQVCNLPNHDFVVWLDIDAAHPGRGSLIRLLRNTLDDESGEDDSFSPLAPAVEVPDMLRGLRHILRRYSDSRLLVVFDNLVLGEAGADLADISRVLNECTQGGCVMVTARTCDHDMLLLLDHPWVVDVADLRLSIDEAHELLALMYGEQPETSEAEALLQLTGGQAGLARLIARHRRMLQTTVTEAERPLELRASLEFLADEANSNRDGPILYAGALLGRGTAEDLAYITHVENPRELERVAQEVPFIHCSGSGWQLRFAFHDYAQEAYSSPRFVKRLPDSSQATEIRRKCFSVLESRGEVDRVIEVLLRIGNEKDLILGLEKLGRKVIHRGCAELIARALANITTSVEKADAARVLASHSGDSATLCSVLLLLGKLHVNMGAYSAAMVYFEEALQLRSTQLDPETMAIMMAHLVIGSGHLARLDSARRYDAEAQRICRQHRVSAYANGYVIHASTIITGLLDGYWSKMGDALLQVSRDPRTPEVLRMRTLNNASHCLASLCRLDEAAEAADQVMLRCEELGLSLMHSCALSTLSTIALGRGDYAEAKRLIDESLLEQGNQQDLAEDPVWIARRLRATDEAEAALSVLSDALLVCGEDASAWRPIYCIERAATLVTLGETAGVIDELRELAKAARISGANYTRLLASLALAQAYLCERDYPAAIEALEGQREYIVSGLGDVHPGDARPSVYLVDSLGFSVTTEQSTDASRQEYASRFLGDGMADPSW